MVKQFTRDHVDPGDTVQLNLDVVAAICHSCLLRASGPSESCITLVESLSMSVTAIPDNYTSESHHRLPVVPLLTHIVLQEKQRADSSLREGIYQLETGEKVPPTVHKELPDVDW